MPNLYYNPKMKKRVVIAVTLLLCLSAKAQQQEKVIVPKAGLSVIV